MVKQGSEKEDLVVTLELRKAPEGPVPAVGGALDPSPHAWYEWETSDGSTAREWWHAVRISLQVVNKGREVPSAPTPVARGSASGPLLRPPRSRSSTMHRSRSSGSASGSESGNRSGRGSTASGVGQPSADRGASNLNPQSSGSRRGPEKWKGGEKGGLKGRTLLSGSASARGTPLADVEENNGDDDDDCDVGVVGGQHQQKSDAEERNDRKLATMVLRDQ